MQGKYLLYCWLICVQKNYRCGWGLAQGGGSTTILFCVDMHHSGILVGFLRQWLMLNVMSSFSVQQVNKGQGEGACVQLSRSRVLGAGRVVVRREEILCSVSALVFKARRKAVFTLNFPWFPLPSHFRPSIIGDPPFPPRKLPAVTLVLGSLAKCKMTSWQFYFAWVDDATNYSGVYHCHMPHAKIIKYHFVSVKFHNRAELDVRLNGDYDPQYFVSGIALWMGKRTL